MSCIARRNRSLASDIPPRKGGTSGLDLSMSSTTAVSANAGWLSEDRIVVAAVVAIRICFKRNDRLLPSSWGDMSSCCVDVACLVDLDAGWLSGVCFEFGRDGENAAISICCRQEKMNRMATMQSLLNMLAIDDDRGVD